MLVDEPDAIDLSDEDPKLALRGGGKSKEVYPLTALVAAQVWMAPQALSEKQLPNGSRLTPRPVWVGDSFFLKIRGKCPKSSKIVATKQNKQTCTITALNGNPVSAMRPKFGAQIQSCAGIKKLPY